MIVYTTFMVYLLIYLFENNLFSLSKFMYRVNVISIKILIDFFGTWQVKYETYTKDQWPTQSHRHKISFLQKCVYAGKNKNSHCFLEECRSWHGGAMGEFSGIMVLWCSSINW